MDEPRSAKEWAEHACYNLGILSDVNVEYTIGILRAYARRVGEAVREEAARLAEALDGAGAHTPVQRRIAATIRQIIEVKTP